MIPPFVAAEGREHHAPADRIAELEKILRRAEFLIHEPGANTSDAWDQLIALHGLAEHCLAWYRVGGLLDEFIAEAIEHLDEW